VQEKVVSLGEAVALIPSEAVVCLGGAGLRRNPMAMTFEMVRQGRRDLHLMAPAAALAADVLVGAGVVRRLETVYTGLYEYGLAPNVRRAAESGQLEIEDWTESTISNRFRAAAHGQPFFVTGVFLGSDHPKYSENIRPITSPFSDEPLHAVRAAAADYTIMHGYQSDSYGNVQWPVRRNTDDFDQEIAQAARKLIVSVERIVSHEQIVRNSTLTHIPGRWVTAIVEAPFGAHPGECDGYYRVDDESLSEYARRAGTEGGMREWLQQYVYGVRDHYDYLDLIGGMRRLSQLNL
jgi:glutaconate CoA-transferase subunit A